MSAYSSRILSLTPRAYWRLGALADSSGNAVSLSAPNGAPATGASLILTDAVDLAYTMPGGTGGVYLRTVTSSPAGLTQVLPITIEAWINLSTVSGACTIIRKADFEFCLRVNNGNLDYFYSDGGGAYTVSTTGAPIAVGNTYHVVVTDSGTNVSFYINGVLYSVAARPSTGIDAKSGPVGLGLNYSAANEWLTGRLDEVAVYGVALTAAQVQGNYTAATVAPPAQTVQVPSVWPAGSNVSIVGQVISGDGHLVGASLGVQFGTPTFTVRFSGAQVGGVASAQSFGVPVIKTTRTLTLTGITSAQSFGAITVKTSAQPISLAGVPSAQQFGRITFYTHAWVQLGGVSSAQQFGTVTPHRFSLHLDCKPDGSLDLGCKPDGGFVITPRPEGSFSLSPSSTGTLTLTPRTDGSVVLVPTDEDG